MIWKMKNTAAGFPELLKSRLPSIKHIHGLGDIELLQSDMVAIVGSRYASDQAVERAKIIGSRAAENGFTVISGNARGIDKAGMLGALVSNGKVVGVLPSGAERVRKFSTTYKLINNGRLTFLSQFDPEDGFSAEQALIRNHTIFALSKGGIAVTSALQRSGTWSGIYNQLHKFHFVPIFVPNVDEPALNKFDEWGARRLPNMRVEEVAAQFFDDLRDGKLT